MLSNFKYRLISYTVNTRAIKLNRRIVVIESDDWGMIRMAGTKAFERLKQKGYPVDVSPYEKNDALENESDLSGLLEVLDSVRDSNSNPAKVTLNMIMANPDFDKIRDSEFSQYYYEDFISTHRRYGSESILMVYKNAISHRLMQPQFHGREHINVKRWLKALRNNDKRFRDAFDEQMYTVVAAPNETGRSAGLDTYGVTPEEIDQDIQKSIEEGIFLFKKTFGFQPKSFIAPCYTWHEELNGALSESGIRYLQGTYVQRVPISQNKLSIKKKYHFLGQRNKHDQIYLVRNVFFEPAEMPSEPVASAMREISCAFDMKKPAIISSHRLNYIGSINPANRSKNLKLLKELLMKIVQKYPDVEFYSSDQLGDIIRKTC